MTITISIHRSKLADLSQEMLGVQECYISVCKEKDKLEENLKSRLEEERRLRNNEVLYPSVSDWLAFPNF